MGEISSCEDAPNQYFPGPNTSQTNENLRLNMNTLFSDLQWLPRPPQDFADRVRALQQSGGQIGSEVQALAGHALDQNQLARLARTINAAKAQGKSLQPLEPFKLALLSNATADFLIPALTSSAARHGLDLEVVKGNYDQVAQEALAPDSSINRAKPDAVLFAIDYRAVPWQCAPGDREGSAESVQRVMDYLESLRRGIKSNSGASCIFQTFAPPVETLFGSLERALPGTRWHVIEEVNRRLCAMTQDGHGLLFDVAGLAATVGLAEWQCPVQWNVAKLPFADMYLPLYADHVGRILAALRGKSRRALILDLDNTIWGGVIGDDDLEGINISRSDALGEAYLSVQQMALDLRTRGIVLAVSSKNNDETARSPFLNHPEMLLKLDHFAVFRANWSDKATNILAISKDLSLGLDALVFVDDNPAERGLVRKLLPQVAVPELPEDPAFYARTLAAAGYFESVTFSREDLDRATYYEENAKRLSLLEQADGIDAYLASLKMIITFQPFDSIGRSRIAQLINKSNQFNLTTRRYREDEIAAFEADASVFTLQVRLADIFGDNGMISVVICKPVGPEVWEIDTWLMSCRVLGRRVETMVLRQILLQARKMGIRRLKGLYYPTDRNKLVANHYTALGFTLISQEANGATQWEIDVNEADPEPAPMEIRSLGFERDREPLNA